MVRRFLPAVLLLSACGPNARTRADADARALPMASGTIVLTGLEFPDAGTTIGGHYGGATFDVFQFGYQISEPVRQRWSRDARGRAEAVLRGAGLRVRSIGMSADPTQLRGIQYGLGGHVTSLQVRSSGNAEPYRVDAQVEVAWELLDLGTGEAIFGRTLRGTAREVGTIDSIVGRAVDGALVRLAADSGFRYALAELRLDPDAGIATQFTRALPQRGDTILLSAEDRNPSRDSSVVGRISAGLATIKNPDQVFGTGFVLTRDGLAIVPARSVRNGRRLRARLANGVERPVRIVRANRALDVALVQIACTECETVDWEAPASVEVFTQIITVGASADYVDGTLVTFGRIGGRWGMYTGVTLDVADDKLAGGEPIARATSGKVFGLVSSRPGVRTAMLLSEVLAALRVRVN